MREFLVFRKLGLRRQKISFFLFRKLLHDKGKPKTLCQQL